MHFYSIFLQIIDNFSIENCDVVKIFKINNLTVPVENKNRILGNYTLHRTAISEINEYSKDSFAHDFILLTFICIIRDIF